MANKCLIQSCQQENCLPHCPCDCHKSKLDWRERLKQYANSKEHKYGGEHAMSILQSHGYKFDGGGRITEYPKS